MPTRLTRSLRRLLKAPLFSAVAILTLAVGIGANTAIFSVVNGVPLKPLPFSEPDRLVGVWHTAPGINIAQLNMGPSNYFTYREESRTFEDIGLWDGAAVTITGAGDPERVQALLISDGTLPILRVNPILGRHFTREDNDSKAPERVMLTHAIWQRKFGGDTSVVGKTLTIESKPYEIIGVLPDHFRFLDRSPQLLMPFRFNRAEIVFANFSYQAIARLKPGVTLEQANADVARMLPLVVERYPMPPGLTKEMIADTKMGPRVRPLTDEVIGDTGQMLWVLLGTVGFVLLIACANVANLFLVRAEGRQQELAIHAALGASWRRITWELMSESLTLAVMGGAAGLLLAYGGLQVLAAIAPEGLPRVEEIGIDPIVLLFTAVISLLAGVLFGLIPVLKFARPQLAGALKEGGRLFQRRPRAPQSAQHPGGGRDRPRGDPAGRLRPDDSYLPGNAKRRSRLHEPGRGVDGSRLDPGVADQGSGPDGAHASADRRAHPTDSRRHRRRPDLLHHHGRLRQQRPDLRRGLPVARRQAANPAPFQVDRRGLLPDDGQPDHRRPPDRVAGCPRPGERRGRVRELRPGVLEGPAAAVGRRIRVNPKSAWRTIIGVAGNEHDDGVTKPAPSIVYWPTLVDRMWNDSLSVQRTMGYAIRTQRADSPTLLQEVQKAVWSINSNLPVANVQTLEEIRAESMAQTSFALVMLMIAAGVALLLGIVGIYGVISYIATQRTREIGIRIALGAAQRDVSRLFLRHGVVLAAIGIALGVAGAAVLTRLMATMLFGVNPLDWMTYLAVATGLGLTAVLASYVPAMRAARTDPAIALRFDI